MAILVTGGAGFIGSHFVEYLLRETNERLIVLDQFNAYYDPALKAANCRNFRDHERVRIVRGDFCDAATLAKLNAEEDVTEIVHLGGYPGVRYSVEHPRIYFETNVLGTQTLLEAAREAGVRRFVFASSSTVYGRGAIAPFREHAALGSPLSPYGTSKLAAESLVRNYYDLYDVPSVSLRFFSVYGSRLRPDLAMSRFAERLTSERAIALYGDGSVLRDFTHVSDICRGILAALYAPGVEGESFNLGHDEPVAISEVIHRLAQEFDTEARIEYRDSRSEDMPLTHADLTNARDRLGYAPRVAFAEGLREFANWYRAEMVPLRSSRAAAVPAA